ncbi:hypothetical protein ASE07_20080 [Noviherbaspirillum sp. Root189]|nr:hypothetical protein ASE07_20080 [Noviherbaspirillum sp. Root189]
MYAVKLASYAGAIKIEKTGEWYFTRNPHGPLLWPAADETEPLLAAISWHLASRDYIVEEWKLKRTGRGSRTNNALTDMNLLFIRQF